MMAIIFSLIPPLLSLGPLALVVMAISYWKKKSAAFRKKNPLNKNLLRSPGESIREELDDVGLDVSKYLAMLSTIPLLLYSMLLTQGFDGKSNISTWLIIIYVLAGVTAVGYYGFALVAIIKRKRLLTIGFEAELAVGQELNELVRNGAWVFHDFPADGFNIDHIVISSKGVLAIETKGRSKPVNRNGKSSAWEVTYNGTNLIFPGWSETEPLEQATRQAKWLQNWVSRAIGESISAKPILVFPGWYVNVTKPNGIFVFNGKNPQMLLQRGQDVLSPNLIERIVHQLDQRCRNIKPT